MSAPDSPKPAGDAWVSAAVIGSLLLFLASLPAPALYNDPPMGTLTGWDCLLNGWYGVRNGYFAWLANPVYLPMLVTMHRRRWRPAIALSALFVGLALLSFQFVLPAIDMKSGPEPEFDGLGPGFWLWLGSGVVPLLAAARCRRRG